jgi:serine kinase of HPr protein (carbohydrate metabolism regulator)
MGNAATIHASCVVIGEAGILIRGGSGSGKSTLARELVHAAAASGRFARLVSDDRTHVAARNGRLVARVVEAIAGRLEARGAGIFAVAHEPSTIVRLVLDLSDEPPDRLPELADQTIDLCGVMVPRLRQSGGAPSLSLVLSRLCCVGDTVVTV